MNDTTDRLPPHDPAAEAGALGCILQADGAASELLDRLTPDHFYEVRHQQVFRALQCTKADGKALDHITVRQWLKDKGQLDDAGGPDYFDALPNATPSPANFPSYFDTLEDRRLRRGLIRDASQVSEWASDLRISGSAIADAARRIGEAHGRDRGLALSDRIAARVFNIQCRPDEPTPRFYVGGTPICTPGNLTVVSGPPKSAKSSFVAAMMSAAMAADADADCLGAAASNTGGRALIHFDTEQSPADHYALIERTLARARITSPPAWLRSYCATGFSANDARAAVPLVAEAALRAFGGIFGVLIDGLADLVNDVNDPAEANAFVNELHGMAIKFDCPILGVIHLNPGTEKTRGHLGSQLERKAETNLRIERDGDAFVVWSEKNRRAPILKPNGPRFVWSDEHHMFVTTETAREAKEKSEFGLMRLQAEAVFTRAERPALRWGEFHALLVVEIKLSESGARKRFEKMIGAQIVRKDLAGLYRLV